MSEKKLPNLTVDSLQKEARTFSKRESTRKESSLYGVTDGKAVGTYLERKFQAWLGENYSFEQGKTAAGMDFPELNVDMKATSIRQPQSSCPFESARQKIYGLGYSLLIFVYEKSDDSKLRISRMNILHTIFVHSSCTADYQTTRGIIDIMRRDGNIDDLIAFMNDRNLPVDDMEAKNLAEEILERPPVLGYLTISNALQWRLQYRRVIEKADEVDGVSRLN